MSYLHVACASALALSAPGCGDSGGSSAIIGSAGGTFTEAGTTVTVPPNALSSEVTFSAVPAPDAPEVTGAVTVGTPITLGPEGQQFALAVTVTMPFDPSRLPQGMSAADVVLYSAPAGTSSYTPLTTLVVDNSHVAAETTHFSTFVPAVSTVPPAWTDVSPSPRPASRLAAVTIAGSLIVVAAGNGTVWTSGDRGGTWASTKVDAGETAQLTMATANDTEIWVAPSAQYAYRAGVATPGTFERRPPTGSGTAPSIAMTGLVVTPTGVLHACGGNGQLISSIDGAMNFTTGSPAGNVMMNGISAREATSNIVAVGQGTGGGIGGIVQSFVDPNLGTIVGALGTGQDAFRAVWVPPVSGPAWIVGDSGVIYRFSMGNPSSTTRVDMVGGTLRAVAGLGTALIAVGDAGLVVRSTNGGTTWTRDASGTTANLFGVSFLSNGEAFAVGDNGTVLRRGP